MGLRSRRHDSQTAPRRSEGAPELVPQKSRRQGCGLCNHFLGKKARLSPTDYRSLSSPLVLPQMSYDRQKAPHPTTSLPNAIH